MHDRFAPYTAYAPRALFLDEDGTAYLAFPDIGVIKYDIDGDKTTFLARNDNTPTAICAYKEQYILLGTLDKGLFLINKETGESKKLQIDESRNSDIYVRHIEKISKDEYWVGAESGIYVLKDGAVQHITYEAYNDLSISDNAIYALFKDREGGDLGWKLLRRCGLYS